MVVFGTRPEAIKMAPLCRKLRFEETFKTIVCVTAQHREMMDQVLEVFSLKPDIDLDIMKKDQDLFDVTSNILCKMKEVLIENNPDIVLVHGDTTTTFTTTLACFYLGIKVGHVEAGLRTNDIHAPFPEEFNRQCTGLMADFHFAPTDGSKNNLLKEGKPEDSIIVTGNTIIDSLNLILSSIEKDETKSQNIDARLQEALQFNWRLDRFILITGHRRENFGAGFLEICKGVRDLATRYPETHFVYPVHLNPNVKQPVQKLLSSIRNVWLIEPLKYEEFVYLLKFSYLVLTDSGGIQEEAPSLGKPVLVMRNITERTEAVHSGTVKLVGASQANIVATTNLLLKDKNLYQKMAKAHNPYGDGKACDRIIEFIREKLHG